MTDQMPETTSAKRGERGELLVMLQFVLMGLFVLTPIASPFNQDVFAATYEWRWAALIALCAIAVGFTLFGMLHIRENLTPLPYPVEDNQLVESGVYSIVRHPLYSSLLFAALGWVVFNLSWSHALVLAVGFVFFDHKASKEERWLTERHPQYEAYRMRVRKFIPWIY